MVSGGQPLHVVWWLVSRASGILALGLVSTSVLLGLAMASRTARRPPVRRVVSRLHEHVALVAVAAIALHGLALLGDNWLQPGLAGISVPFALHYRPLYTGIGIISGYAILLLGPSFYLRRRIGPKRWRRLHPILIVAWVLAAVHTLGSGSDAGQVWLRLVVLAPLPGIAYLGVVRLAGRNNRPHAVRAETGARPVGPAPALSTRSAGDEAVA